MFKMSFVIWNCDPTKAIMFLLSQFPNRREALWGFPRLLPYLYFVCQVGNPKAMQSQQQPKPNKASDPEQTRRQRLRPFGWNKDSPRFPIGHRGKVVEIGSPLTPCFSQDRKITKTKLQVPTPMQIMTGRGYASRRRGQPQFLSQTSKQCSGVCGVLRAFASMTPFFVLSV